MSADKDNERPIAHIVRVERHLRVGPLPSPEDLRQYEALAPGTANRLLSMVEQQLGSQQRDTHDKIRNSTRGIYCAFGIGVFGILAGTYAAVCGHDWFGTIVAGGTLASIVGAFIYGTKVKQ